MTTTLPTFTVAGVARGGTSAVTELIRSHPDGFVTQPKEPHYYAFAGRRVSFSGPGADAGINRKAVVDKAAFLKLFAGAGDHSVRGDGSVSSFYYWQDSLPAMLDINADLKVVVVLRDPVERAYSSWRYLRVRGLEEIPTFTDALLEEHARVVEGRHHLWHYQQMSQYAEALSAFQSAIGPERLHVVIYDELVKEAEATSATLLRFLGLDPVTSVQQAPPTVNRSGRPRSTAALQLMNTARKVAPLRAAVRRTVPFHLRERVRNLNLRVEEPSIPGRTELVGSFREDLRHVESILGRDLPPSWFV